MTDQNPTQENSEQPSGPSKSELKKRAKAAEKEKKAAEKAAKQAELAQQQAANEVDYSTEFYGALPLNQSQSRPRRERSQISSLSSRDGETVLIRARVHTSRAKSSKLLFLNLRQRTHSVQAILAADAEKISKQMVKWASNLADESIVLVEGLVKKSPIPIQGATVSDVEIDVKQIHLISGIDGRLPFSLDDASRPDAEIESSESQFNRVLIDTRLNNRVVDLRTQTNQAVFKIQGAIGDLFRDYLSKHGFTEIHSPKLQGAATESGASVFKSRDDKSIGNAYLAQSPQLAKQMAIAADFERVYEIGPVFRAEDSNTYRHMTEFIGLDLEMTIEEHYHEVMETLDGLFLSIFRGLRDQYQHEIETVRKQFPAEEFKWREGPEGTLRLTHREAVQMLIDDGIEIGITDDMNTENERRLGGLVKAKYDTDYFIIDKFPMDIRPFYTMPDPDDPTVSNSYDFFMRGEEILSGAQRIHDPKLLMEKMRSKGVDPDTMKSYVDAFRMGCAPHGGGGIGLERVLMLFLKLNNIRRASLFPRDPKRLDP
ncbi:hypothetical protein H0H93_012506 [Arthromyces matolae]|nr:hypothetical protein H0H93_012506 [Arthromyces matolae]